MNGHQVSIAPHQAGPDDLVIFHGDKEQTVWRNCRWQLANNGMVLEVYDFSPPDSQGVGAARVVRRYNMMHVTQWFYGTNDGKCGNGPFLRNSKATPMFCEYRAGHDGRCSYLDLP